MYIVCAGTTVKEISCSPAQRSDLTIPFFVVDLYENDIFDDVSNLRSHS